MSKKEKIIQVSGFGVENTRTTQSNFMIVGLTNAGKVVITTGDGVWSDISPKDNSTGYQSFIHKHRWFPRDSGQAKCRICGEIWKEKSLTERE